MKKHHKFAVIASILLVLLILLFVMANLNKSVAPEKESRISITSFS